MSEQLCDREDLMKKLFNTGDKDQIRRILIEASVAKLAEPPMTEGERIAKERISASTRGDYIRIDGSPHIDIKLPCLSLEEAIVRVKEHYAAAIDAALAKRTEDAAKIVENPCYLTRETSKPIAAAIRKLGEAK